MLRCWLASDTKSDATPGDDIVPTQTRPKIPLSLRIRSTNGAASTHHTPTLTPRQKSLAFSNQTSIRDTRRTSCCFANKSPSLSARCHTFSRCDPCPSSEIAPTSGNNAQTQTPDVDTLSERQNNRGTADNRKSPPGFRPKTATTTNTALPDPVFFMFSCLRKESQKRVSLFARELKKEKKKRFLAPRVLTESTFRCLRRKNKKKTNNNMDNIDKKAHFGKFLTPSKTDTLPLMPKTPRKPKSSFKMVPSADLDKLCERGRHLFD